VSASPDRKTALVTGGTDGIGKEIARGLARQGFDLVIVGRNAAKGEGAARDLRHSSRNPAVAFVQADLALMRDVTRLADLLGGRWPALHYLVHDAGVVLGRRELTPEGIEANFAINYLSRFVLTRQLLPLLAAGSGPDRVARIVIVSGAARGGSIHFDDVNLAANFATLRAVLQSCRANDLFTIELARRLSMAAAGPGPTVTCLKIGVVKTNIRHGFPGWMKLLVPLLDPLLGQTPQDAAAAGLRLLLADDLEGVTGALFLKIRKLKRLASDTDPATLGAGWRLWELSERLAAQALAAVVGPTRNTAPECADKSP
jgi:NAD(P)-dependent dehydrogenase (short-subunit alcohol dehydrogenase family)